MKKHTIIILASIAAAGIAGYFVYNKYFKPVPAPSASNQGQVTASSNVLAQIKPGATLQAETAAEQQARNNSPMGTSRKG